MGYLLDYELFQPCWYCGKTDCNGNHPNDKQAEVARQKITHFKNGFDKNCPCKACNGGNSNGKS